MSTPFRVVVRSVISVFSAVLLVMIGAGSAAAETPTSWADPAPTTALRELLLYGGSLLGLMVGLTLFSLVIHRNNYVPPEPSDEIDTAQEQHPAQH